MMIDGIKSNLLDKSLDNLADRFTQNLKNFNVINGNNNDDYFLFIKSLAEYTNGVDLREAYEHNIINNAKSVINSF